MPSIGKRLVELWKGNRFILIMFILGVLFEGGLGILSLYAFLFTGFEVMWAIDAVIAFGSIVLFFMMRP